MNEEWFNVVSIDDLRTLPRWALIVLAARAADRAFPLFKGGAPDRDVIRGAIDTCYAWSAAGSGSLDAAYSLIPAQSASDASSHAYDKLTLSGTPNDEAKSTYLAGDAAAAAISAAGVATIGRDNRLPEFADRAIACAYEAATLVGKSIEDGVRRDFDILSDLTKSKHLDDTSAVSNVVFSVSLEFDLGSPVHETGTIIDVSSSVNRRIMEHLARNPECMYELGSRQFEELLAEIFSGFGFDVELTQQTRDGGYDIIAIKSQELRLKYLIEAKRYGPDKKVGVNPVRQLLGTVGDQRATKGIIATTAPAFTRPATDLIEKNEWLLDGADFARVASWLRHYDNSVLRGIVGASEPWP